MGPSSAPGEEEGVTDASLRAATLRLLDAADPVSDTERRIRSRLEAEFGAALTREQRATVRACLEGWLRKNFGKSSARNGGRGGTAAAGAAKKEKKRPREADAQTGCLLSEPLRAFLGVERMPRTQIVKKIWAYVKEKKLQDPADKRNILIDDALAGIFKPPVRPRARNPRRRCAEAGV